jgi:indole-3-glycerol phosphate synthase
MSILEQIYAHKRLEVAAAERVRPLDAVIRDAEAAPAPPDFMLPFQVHAAGSVAMIAEIKRRSPSKGDLNPDLDPARTARTYRDAGAAAISVLTDAKYFAGNLEDLRLAAAASGLPVLRKDFIFSPYQIFEARAAGASAALLIVGMLADPLLAELVTCVLEAGLTALVEVHSRDEIERALESGAGLIGINNRDLHSFDVRLETTFELRQVIPAGIPVIAESGIGRRADITALARAGVDGVLIGEALVRAQDPGRLLRELAGSA